MSLMTRQKMAQDWVHHRPMPVIGRWISQVVRASSKDRRRNDTAVKRGSECLCQQIAMSSVSVPGVCPLMTCLFLPRLSDWLWLLLTSFQMSTTLLACQAPCKPGDLIDLVICHVQMPPLPRTTFTYSILHEPLGDLARLVSSAAEDMTT